MCTRAPQNDEKQDHLALGRPAWVVLRCEAVTDVDVTAAAMPEQLDQALNTAGMHMAFAELRSRLQILIRDYGLYGTLHRDHFYPTLDAAIAVIHPRRAGPQRRHG